MYVVVLGLGLFSVVTFHCFTCVALWALRMDVLGGICPGYFCCFEVFVFGLTGCVVYE